MNDGLSPFSRYLCFAKFFIEFHCRHTEELETFATISSLFHIREFEFEVVVWRYNDASFVL